MQLKMSFFLFAFSICCNVARGQNDLPNAGRDQSRGCKRIETDREALDCFDGLPLSTTFNRLKVLFDEATVPKTLEDLEGCWSGRYIRGVDPDRMLGTLMIAAPVVGSPAGGPLFGPQFRIFFAGNFETKPSRYDFIIKDPALLAEVDHQLVVAAPMLRPPQLEPEGVVLPVYRSDREVLARYVLRMNGPFLMVRFSWTERDIPPDYAYYFPLVTPAHRCRALFHCCRK